MFLSQKNQFSTVLLVFITSQSVILILGFIATAGALSSQSSTESYFIQSGYDVNNTAPIASTLIASSFPAQTARDICVYLCATTTSCAIAVLTANYTCNVYNVSARMNAYIVPTSTMYQPQQINGYLEIYRVSNLFKMRLL
jgi:hypothetical protein